MCQMGGILFLEFLFLGSEQRLKTGNINVLIALYLIMIQRSSFVVQFPQFAIFFYEWIILSNDSSSFCLQVQMMKIRFS